MNSLSLKYIPALLLICGLLPIGCRPGNKQPGKKQPRGTSVLVSPVPANAAAPETSIDKTTFARRINHHMDSVTAILPHLSSKNADQLYKTTKIFIDSQITLYCGEAHFLNWYINTDDPAPQPDSIMQELALYRSLRMEAWDVGEGIMELRPLPDFYLRIFGRYLSPDFRSFVQLTCSEDSVLYQADAAIIIPYTAIAERLIHWEQFIRQYPGSALKKAAQESYAYYLSGYLLGEDNTPTFENDVMQEEPLHDYQMVAATYPDTYTGTLSRQFLEQFRDQASGSDERHAFLDHAIQVISSQ